MQGSDSICVFERQEKKFLVTETQRRSMIKRIQEYMYPDKHGESTVYSLYFDTESFRLIRDSIERPIYKEKLRLRSYGRPLPDSTVFLELKKKYKGIVYKRRLELRYSEFKQWLNGESLPQHSQIADEIEYFMSYYKDLKPRALLCYDRCAYFANEDMTTRITFDRNIRCRTCDILPENGDDGEALLQGDLSVMEVKFYNAVPKYLSDIITELGIRPFTFSKYGAAYKTKICS